MSQQNTVLKVGLGVVMIGIMAYTLDYLFKQIRLLIRTKFDMVGTSVNSINEKGVSISLWWKVKNESDIKFIVSDQVYDVFLDGKFIKKVGYSPAITVAPRSEARIPTHIVFTLSEAVRVGVNNVAGLLTKEGRKQLKLEVRGHFTVKTDVFTIKKVPFEFVDSIENIYNY
jgi:LEA14-like dessication related protein